MARALQLARRGFNSTDPNPRVGCVVVRDGEIVGEGWHERAGEGHAEVNALRDAGDKANGATAYVTLEPCCHFGRTPPCTHALMSAGIERVVVGMKDPNPMVAGKGIKQLEVAEIEVISGVLENEARALNEGFIMRMSGLRPFVRSKLAASLDGRTAMASGESQWITGEAARADVQALRARSSVILTGIGTVLADDPHLNVREPENARQPLRVVVDSNGRMPADARMLSLPGETLVVTCADNFELDNAEVEYQASLTGKVNLETLMESMARRDVNEILVEAGPTLNGALLQAGLIDELVIYLAPHLMGAGARGMFDVPGLDAMADRIELETTDVRQVGDDLRITLRVNGQG